jgi:hypothetical protein
LLEFIGFYSILDVLVLWVDHKLRQILLDSRISFPALFHAFIFSKFAVNLDLICPFSNQSNMPHHATLYIKFTHHSPRKTQSFDSKNPIKLKFHGFQLVNYPAFSQNSFFNLNLINCHLSSSIYAVEYRKPFRVNGILCKSLELTFFLLFFALFAIITLLVKKLN